MKDFKQWNEKMVFKYHHEDFYEKQRWWWKFIEHRRFRKIISMINPKGLVLDAGCGDGHLCHYLPSWRYLGIDISKEQIRKCRKKHYDYHFMQCDISSLNGEHEMDVFPSVVCTEVIEHCNDPMMLMKALRNVLKPKGVLVMTVPNEDFRDRMKPWGKHFGWKDEVDLWHMHRFSDIDIRNLARRTGFKILKRAGTPMSFMPASYIYRMRK